MDNLPLKADKGEAHLNHLYLVDFSKNRPELILNSTQRYTQLFSIYAKIFDLKFTTQI